MLDSYTILRLYINVLFEDIAKNGVSENDIRSGVRDMATLYAPDPGILHSDKVERPDFNKRSHRCAYLHKYAPLHTALVQNVIQRILQKHRGLFRKNVMSGQFKLCCLGGGPGSDGIGVLAALMEAFNSFHVNLSIVDIMEGWESTFVSLIEHIRYGDFGIPGNYFHPDFVEWNYISADLLGPMIGPVNRAISAASLVTMVKFISAAANLNTKQMVQKIFNAMKPGALVLFIDNAAGKFDELVRDMAIECDFITIFRHLHCKYSNQDLEAHNFGYKSCIETTVSIHLLRKPFQNKQSKNRNCNIPNRKKQPKTTSLLPDYDVSHISRATPEFHNHTVRSMNDTYFKPIVSQNNALPHNVNLNANVNFLKVSSTKLNLSVTNHQKLNNRLSTNKCNEVPTRKNISSNEIPTRKTISSNEVPTRKNMSSTEIPIRKNMSSTEVPTRKSMQNNNSHYSYSPLSSSTSTSPTSNTSHNLMRESQSNALHQSADPVDNCCSCCVIS